MYQIVDDKVVKRIADNAFIPYDTDNLDYQEYLKWVADGNEPLPADAPEEASNVNSN